MEATKIVWSDEAWDSGELGQDEKFVRRAESSDDDERVIDESLGLVRRQKQ